MAADAYARAIARVVAGQVAELSGFEAVQDSAIEVLAELLLRYMTELATGAHTYADVAGRSGINLHDVLLSLDDLGGSVESLQAYLDSLISDSNTFAHPLPQFPIQKASRALPTWEDKKEEPPSHIPAFLPAFPDKHTYNQTAKFRGHEQDPAQQAQFMQQERRKAETSLVKLHRGLTAATAKASGAEAGASADATASDQQQAQGASQMDMDDAAGPSDAGTAAAGPGSSYGAHGVHGTEAAAGLGLDLEGDSVLSAFREVLAPGSSLIDESKQDLFNFKNEPNFKKEPGTYLGSEEQKKKEDGKKQDDGKKQYDFTPGFPRGFTGDLANQIREQGRAHTTSSAPPNDAYADVEEEKAAGGRTKRAKVVEDPAKARARKLIESGTKYLDGRQSDGDE